MRTLMIFFCIAASLLSLSARAAQPAGEVIFVKGDVTARDAQNQTRVLAKGAAVNAGDTLATGANALLQLRFVDGAQLSLRENTEYRIEAYLYNDKNADASSSIATLLKGGLRAITGLIAKQRSRSYEMKTPAAIIGVRGTSFSLYYDQSRGLHVGVTQGTVSLTNNTGTLNLGPTSAHQYAQVTNMNAAIIGSTQAPPVLINIMSNGTTSTQSTTSIAPTTESISGSTSIGGSAFLPPPNLDPKITLQPTVQPSASSSGGPAP